MSYSVNWKSREMSVAFQSSQWGPDQDHTFVLAGKLFMATNKTRPREVPWGGRSGVRVIASGALRQSGRKASGRREGRELVTGRAFQEVWGLEGAMAAGGCERENTVVGRKHWRGGKFKPSFPLLRKRSGWRWCLKGYWEHRGASFVKEMNLSVEKKRNSCPRCKLSPAKPAVSRKWN